KADCFLNDSGMLAYNKDTKKHYFDQNSGRVAYIDIVPNYYDEKDPKNNEIIRVIATHAPAEFDNNGAIIPRRHLFSQMFKKGDSSMFENGGVKNLAPIQYPNGNDNELKDAAYGKVPRTHVFMGDFNTDHYYLCDQNGFITPDDKLVLEVAGGGDDYGDYSACRLHEYFSGDVKGYPQVYNLTHGGNETHYPTNVPADLQFDYIVTDKFEYSLEHVAHNRAYEPVQGNFDHVPVVGEIRRPWSDYDVVSSQDSARFWGEYNGDDSNAEIVAAEIEAIEDGLGTNIRSRKGKSCKVENGVWDCEFQIYIDNSTNPKWNSDEAGLYTAYIKYTSKSGNVGVQSIRFGLYECRTEELWSHAQLGVSENQRFEARAKVVGDHFYAINTVNDRGEILGIAKDDNNKVVSLENRGNRYYDHQAGGWISKDVWIKVPSCHEGVPDRPVAPKIEIKTMNYNDSNCQWTFAGSAASRNSSPITDVDISLSNVIAIGGKKICEGTTQWMCQVEVCPVDLDSVSSEINPEFFQHYALISANTEDGMTTTVSEKLVIAPPSITIDTVQISDARIEVAGIAEDADGDLKSISARMVNKSAMYVIDMNCDGLYDWNCFIDRDLLPGEYELVINATDTKGNAVSKKVEFEIPDLSSITINQNGSDLNISGKNADSYDEISVEFNGKAVICDGESLWSCDFDLSSIDEPGGYEVVLTAYSAGIVQTYTVLLDIDVDYIPVKVGSIPIIVPKAKLVQ
ncbi:MAG: hypothetical protein D6B27_06730, partial [Gammaproteobacteria bacterium]